MGAAVSVPDRMRVPLAAWLLAGVSGILDRDATAALREGAARLEKVRGKGATAAKKEASSLKKLAHSLECLMQELLEADPETSTKFEYRPEYYADRQHRLVEEGKLEKIPERVIVEEDLDDSPAPWEPF